jgi:hypothetical protein
LQRIEAPILFQTLLLAGDALMEEQGQDREWQYHAAGHQQPQSTTKGRKVLSPEDWRKRQNRAEKRPQHCDGRSHNPVCSGRMIGHSQHQPLPFSLDPSQSADITDLNPSPTAASVEELARSGGVQALDLGVQACRNLTCSSQNRGPDRPATSVLDRSAGLPVTEQAPRLDGDRQLEGVSLGIFEEPGPKHPNIAARRTEVSPSRNLGTHLVDQQQLGRRLPLSESPSFRDNRRKIVQATRIGIGGKIPHHIDFSPRQNHLTVHANRSTELHRDPQHMPRKTQ